MFKEIIINADPNETRIAVLEDGELVELLIERPRSDALVGDIYKGRATAVLPGIQAAFVEIGLPKSAFLHMSDMMESMLDVEMFDIDDGPAHPRQTPRRSQDRGPTSRRARRSWSRSSRSRSAPRGRRSARGSAFRVAISC